MIAQSLQEQQISQQMAQIKEIQAKQQQSAQLVQSAQQAAQPKDPRLRLQETPASQPQPSQSKAPASQKTPLDKLLEDLPAEYQEKLSKLPKQFLLFEKNAKKVDATNQQILSITQHGEGGSQQQTESQALMQTEESKGEGGSLQVYSEQP